MTHSRKLYEALQTEKCSIEEENSELLNTNTVLKEEQRTMELELVVAKKDVSCRKKNYSDTVWNRNYLYFTIKLMEQIN